MVQKKALIIGLAVSITLCSGFLYGQGKSRLTFAQIFKNAEPRIFNELPFVTGWADDNSYIANIKKEGDPAPRPYRVSVATGRESPYRNLDQYKSLVEAGININFPASYDAGYSKLIFVKDKDLYFLDIQKKNFKRLTETTAEEKNPTLAPDGGQVAFTRDNDLFVVDTVSGREIRLTSDGGKFIYNGWASWIYFEEILGRASRYRAFWWSPDSKRIAFMRFDDTKVPLFPIYNAEGVHGSLEETPYPKPGDPSPEVRIGIADLSSGGISWADFNEKDDQYFGTPYWTPDGRRLFVQWMNRGQDTFKLYALDAQTARKSELYTEQQKSWIDWLDEIRFLKGERGFIVTSDRDGWAHLYLYAADGKLKNRITSGKWTVTGIGAVDDENETVYFTARKEDSTRTDLYRISLNGRNQKRLTFGAYNHNVRVSPKGKHFITSYSNLDTPTRIALCTGDGKMIRLLGDSKGKEFDNYELARTELLRIKTADGIALPAALIKPLDFNAAKKYAVLISIYGGPNSSTVYDSWPRGRGSGLEPQWLAQEGIVQMSVDHRGSGHFGKEGVALMHRSLGKWEMNDYIEAVKWLHAQPWVDKGKICITGGSYGGFVTCMALTYGADWFTFGIALFSVTDYRLYDSHYTERYMDSPKENPEGYDFTSTMKWADKYKGVLRIVHGTMDDNVHMQNSIQLVDKLQSLGKHFEMMFYPGGRHGWGGPKAAHLRTETYRFYYQYLLEKPFPENLFK